MHAVIVASQVSELPFGLCTHQANDATMTQETVSQTGEITTFNLIKYWAVFN